MLEWDSLKAQVLCTRPSVDSTSNARSNSRANNSQSPKEEAFRYICFTADVCVTAIPR